MTTIQEKIIKHSLDSFYRLEECYEQGGEETLLDLL
jgi:hypothetical protein